jgi:transposase
VDDEIVLNRTYAELARHYGFQIDPTPVRSPEKKGKVERDVKYVKGNFLATWESVGIDADRVALRRWVTEIADRRRHGTTGRVPAELFDEAEREALLPLPKRPWEKVV